jgi:hypothetical protein
MIWITSVKDEGRDCRIWLINSPVRSPIEESVASVADIYHYPHPGE